MIPERQHSSAKWAVAAAQLWTSARSESRKPRLQSKLGGVDVITARALAPLPRLLELAAPAFSAHTVALFLKGREAEAEVAAARRRWTFDATLEPSLTDAGGRIVAIKALEVEREE
ncbi:RsmG family class I SAM-dependent methyltransferase [Hyphomicrobium sp. D-2]|uniref:RsmG family class I SAM-dependent methyltransferase n=1 Tax=Hyphomicrobium sp. D-2 TaxID=3041621 RepID=UPI0032AFFC20